MTGLNEAEIQALTSLQQAEDDDGCRGYGSGCGY